MNKEQQKHMREIVRREAYGRDFPELPQSVLDDLERNKWIEKRADGRYRSTEHGRVTTVEARPTR